MSDSLKNQKSAYGWNFTAPVPPFQPVIWISISIVFIIGLLDLAGWICNITLLKSVLGNAEPMKKITAVCFLISCSSLAIIQNNSTSFLKKIIPGIVGGLLCFTSLATIYSYIYSINNKPAPLLTGWPCPAFITAPLERMAFLTACNFLLIGCIILLLPAGKPRRSGIAHLLIIPVICVSYFVTSSYILGVYSVNDILKVPVALNTGFAFAGLCVAILFIRPDTWLMKIFISKDSGGIFARKLLPWLLILPIIIGWIRIRGEHLSIFRSEEGVVLVATTYALCFLALIAITAKSVNKIDRKRRDTMKALKESITRRILAENELQRTKNYLENLIDNANAPIIVWNTNDEIELFNHAFEHLTGYSSKEVIGKKLELLFPFDSFKESNAKPRESLTKNWKTIEIPIQTKNQKIRTILWNSATIYDTDNKTVLSTIAQGNDITDRKKAEHKVKVRTRDLEIANARLNKELRDRILAEQALKASEDKLKELNATKDKFFNIVAHDLKNPFTSLIGSSELLYQNIHNMDNEKIRTLALILNDTSKSGYTILQNLLDWSRSQTGLLIINPEKINLRSLIHEHIINLEQISANKKIKIYSRMTEDIYITADKNMLKTILRNLLSNAVKYSYRNGKIFVNAIAEDGKVIISVQDNGIGIPEEYTEKIFRIDEKYSHLGTENEHGTGLGLKLCKEFVEKQGGNIWVESTENKGSEFKFSIPSKIEVTTN